MRYNLIFQLDNIRFKLGFQKVTGSRYVNTHLHQVNLKFVIFLVCAPTVQFTLFLIKIPFFYLFKLKYFCFFFKSLLYKNIFLIIIKLVKLQYAQI